MIQVPGILTRFSTRSDGSAGLSFITNELADDDFSKLRSHLNKFGFILFKENEFSVEDIPEDDADEDKTPSQRLRAILFIEWKQKDGKTDFNSYYRMRMDSICEKLKKQLGE